MPATITFAGPKSKSHQLFEIFVMSAPWFIVSTPWLCAWFAYVAQKQSMSERCACVLALNVSLWQLRGVRAILGNKPMLQRRHTCIEPIGDALAAWDHHIMLEYPWWIDGSCMLLDHMLVPWSLRHAFSQFIASVSPKVLVLQQFGQSEW